MIISCLLQFVCFLHASEDTANQQAQSTGKLTSFMSFVKNTPLLGAIVTAFENAQQAVVAQVQEIDQNVISMQKLLENPNEFKEFYQKMCVCPDQIDPEVFKILVGMAFKDLVAEKDTMLIFKSYQQDQNGLSSDLGKSIFHKAVALMHEPLIAKEIYSPKLPLFSGTVPQYLKEAVDDLRTDKDGKPLKLHDHLVVATSQIFDQFDPSMKKALLGLSRKPVICGQTNQTYESLRIIYNELVDRYYILLKSGNYSWEADNGKELLQRYLSVVQFCMKSKDYDYYLLQPATKEYKVIFDEKIKAMREKVTRLYLIEKFKYLLEKENAGRELIKEETTRDVTNMLSEYAKHGFLSKETFKH